MSRTRIAIGPEQVETLARTALGSSVRVARTSALRGGTINACWGVTLADGRSLVLKAAPPPDLPHLGHEHDLLRTEVEFYRRAAGAGAPVPEVVSVDFSRSVLGSDYFWMTRLPGEPLAGPRGLGRRLARADRARVREALGRIAARLATVRGEVYGYPQPGARTRAETWRAAFLRMLGVLLEDAERLGVALPRGREALAALVERWAPALDLVDTPRLVHFDLWDGNVLIEGEAGEVGLSGIVDGERAFWGDPLMEMASLALFGEIERDAAFLRGYADGAGAPLVFDEPTRARVALGQLYLYLVMRVEPATRGSDWMGRLVVAPLVSRSLRRALRILERPR